MLHGSEDVGGWGPRYAVPPEEVESLIWQHRRQEKWKIATQSVSALVALTLTRHFCATIPALDRVVDAVLIVKTDATAVTDTTG